MEKILNNIFPKYIIKNIKSFISSEKSYNCLYCGHVYKSRNIKFNDSSNCSCYYKWIYFHSSDYY